MTQARILGPVYQPNHTPAIHIPGYFCLAVRLGETYPRICFACSDTRQNISYGTFYLSYGQTTCIQGYVLPGIRLDCYTSLGRRRQHCSSGSRTHATRAKKCISLKLDFSQLKKCSRQGSVGWRFRLLYLILCVAIVSMWSVCKY